MGNIKRKLVSVILPVYNGGKYLEQSMRSVLDQTYKNLELIIVNDASTDNSLYIAQNLARDDSRIRIITNPENLKLAKSLNKGFENANGEYYTWTSDDNYYDISAIEKMVNYLEENRDSCMVCCDFIRKNEITNEEEVVKLNISPEEMIYANCIGPCFLYRKDIVDKIGKYNPKEFLVEDYDYWLRMMLKGNISHISEVLYTYRIHQSSLTGTRIIEIMNKTSKLVEKYLPIYKEKFKDLEFKNIKTKKKLTMLQRIFSIKNDGDRKIIRLLGIKIKLKRRSEKKKIDYLEKYRLAKQWIERYSVDNKGIAVESSQPKIIYPEVTGYYIPTLLKFGDREKAVNYGDYLLTIQNEDGSWSEPIGKIAYTFDTSQILKGLIALIENGLDKNDKYKIALLKGCDWILSMQREDGSIATPDYSYWQLPYDKNVPEAIHIYCLEPLGKTSKLYNLPRYKECIKKALKFYLFQENLTDFNTLSHFHAYIIEGLIDIGEIDRARSAMQQIELFHQKANGSIPAYSDVDFVCSTGLFQYAVCWYKLGETKLADKVFNYAINLQNKSGGWYGSYGKKANYFPEGEISWAVKYFLDAIYYGQKAKYKQCANIFSDNIDSNDGRYLVIEEELNNDNYQEVLDLGCGKGRYTKKLIEKYPNKKFYCVDLSTKVMEYIDFDVEKKEGSILNIPYLDNKFDFVFITEALEHTIDIDNAIREISRIIKPNGKVVIIDKDKKFLGKLELAQFEQWFDEQELCKLLEKNGFNSYVKTDIQYKDSKNGLFNAWIGEKNTFSGASDINKRLTKQEWGNLYNKEMLESLVNNINKKIYFVQTKEILDIIPNGSKTLEIGSGTGQTSLCLALKGCDATILDYEEKCLELSKIAAKSLGTKINTICIDATKDLPFEEREFDVIFHSGLLEHFTKEERIELLRNWKRYCKKMVSLVPNAASIAYRVGKERMEINGTWIYGIENPLYTQVDDFIKAGYVVQAEYTIGRKHALNFLDEKDELRRVLKKYIINNEIKNDYHQGYLLVTIGNI